MIRLTLALLLIATPALADPCKAIPDRGPMPSYLREGVPFRGPVGYVGDGDSICVAVGGRDAVSAGRVAGGLRNAVSGQKNGPSVDVDSLSLVEVRLGQAVDWPKYSKGYYAHVVP